VKNNNFFQSIQHAFNGIKYFFLTERNAQIQLMATLVIIALAIVLGATAIEWMLLLLCIAMVLCFEMFNTSLECLCDVVHKENHPIVKLVKDIAAGAVLTVTIISCIIGILIFLPKILNLFS